MWLFLSHYLTASKLHAEEQSRFEIHEQMEGTVCNVSSEYGRVWPEFTDDILNQKVCRGVLPPTVEML